MKPPHGFVFACLGILFPICIMAVSQAQEDDRAAAIARSATPGYVRVAPRAVDLSQPAPTSVVQGMTLAFPPGATSSRAVFAQPSPRSPAANRAAPAENPGQAASQEESF